MDWSKPAKLIERQDDGSEMFFEFRELASDTLQALVTRVATMPASERARMVIDAGTAGTFNVGEIVALAARSDFPVETR